MGDLFTIEEWKISIREGWYNEYDGSGRFLKDGKRLTGEHYDNVFGLIPKGATHVEWFNK